MSRLSPKFRAAMRCAKTIPKATDKRRVILRWFHLVKAAIGHRHHDAARQAGVYPAKSAGDPAAVVPPARHAEAMGKAIPESRLAEIATGQEAIAQRPRGFTPIDATELPAGTKPLADELHGAAGSLSVKDMATPQPAAMAAPRSDTVQNSFAPGANYAPLVDNHPAAVTPATGAKSVADLPAPIRREKILGEFAKDLGTTIYEGRVKGKNRLGFFRPNLQEVRIKRASDLEVAAHEIGHLLDDRVPAISNAWRSNNKALREPAIATNQRGEENPSQHRYFGGIDGGIL